ncbi:MAG TPA: hypothetical protein VLY04_22940 [Bryobacteraceae bacterium]|nr:hypothetical protein [Bryobacteraceae bacterium]
MQKRAFTMSNAAGPVVWSRHANHLVCGALAVLLLSLGALAQTPRPENEFVIRNARIFDGSRVIAKGDVWVKNGMIEAVGAGIKTPSESA